MDISMDYQQRTSDLITPEIIEASGKKNYQFPDESSTGVYNQEASETFISVETPNVDSYIQDPGSEKIQIVK